MTSPVKEVSQARLLIALLPPSNVQTYAEAVIQELSQHYHSRTSKAPPHITLQPPFQWPLAAIPELEADLAEFANQQPAIPIRLDGFGAFAPRVLYLNVAKTSELLVQQALLVDHLAGFGIAEARSPQRPFTPHLTVASRNLTRQTFHQAWAELQNRSVQFDFIIDRLSLLIYQAQHWQIQTEFLFGRS